MAGKKLRDEDLVLNIIVNGDKGKKEIGQLERAIKDTNAELATLEKQEKKLRQSGKKDTEQYKAVTAAIKQKNDALVLSEARLKQLKQGLDLNNMSLRDLRAEMNRLSMLRNIADPGSENWRKHDAQLKIVRDRYNQVRGQSELTGNSIQKMSSQATRYIGAIAASVTSVIAAFSGVRKATDMFAAFDDQVADVMKTTGLLKEEVLEIDQNLRNFDTRTSQEELLKLGRVAGKLGIDTREEVEGFIRAADQIGVALSEDLGGDIEQAINDIGKLVDIFNVTDQFGIEEAMLKTGSVINKIGAASSANEGYLVDFTKRLGGVGPAAGISISNIVGLGATLDQFGQSVEVSGTAMSQLIVNMFDDTAKFARIAGQDVNYFTRLLETDANEALITLLEGVKGNESSMTELVSRLKELGINGARATQVVSVLSNNTDTLRIQQLLANDAFEKGTSLSDEFAIKNETAAAQLEKAKKQVNLLWIELGEKLFPVITAGNDLLAMMLRLVLRLIDFFQEHRRIIITLTATIVAYNLALFASNNAMRLWSVLVARGSAVMRIFNTVTKANPFVLIATLAVAAGTAIYQYTQRLTSAEKAQRKLNDVRMSGIESVAKEKVEMEQLLNVARDKNRSDEERIEAISRLKDMAPGYLDNLSLETINTDEATEATERYIETLIKKASVQSAVDDVAEINKRLEKIKQGQEEELTAWQQTKLWTMRVVGFMHESENEMIEGYRKENRENLEADLLAQKDLLTKFIQENMDLNNPLKEKEDDDDKPDVVLETEAQRKAREKAEKEAEKLRKKEEKELEDKLQKQAAYRQKVLEGQMSLIDQERLAFQKRLQEAGIFGKQRQDMTEEEVQVMEALQREHYAKLNQLDADAMKKAIDQKQAAFDKELQELRISHNEQYKEIKTMEEARAFLRDDLTPQALAGLRNMRQAQQEIDKKFRREEEAMVSTHMQELKAQLQSVLDSGQWEGLNLSDKILSDEEKEVLEGKIAEFKELISQFGLGSGKEGAEDRGMRKTNVDMLGFTRDDWDSFYENLKEGKLGVEGVLMATQALGQVWSQYNAMKTAGEQRELQEYEAANRKKEASLKKRLQSGAITQEQYNQEIDRLNADLDKKRAVYERNQAKRERNVALMSAIVNTAAAVTKVLANPILAAFVGAMGALQIGTILNTSLPEIPGAEKGGYLDVVRSQDKRMFRSRGMTGPGYVDEPRVLVGESGREFVASNEAYNNPTIRPVLDAIDTAQKNGTISTVNLEKIMAQRIQMFTLPGRQRGGFVRDTPSSVNQPMGGMDPEVKELIRQNNELMDDLKEEIKKGIRARVGLLGRDGFFEAMDDYERIEKNVNL